MTFSCVAVLLAFVLSVNGDACWYDQWSLGEAHYRPMFHDGKFYIRTICNEGYYTSSNDVILCVDGITDKPLPQCLKANGDPCHTRVWRIGETEYLPVIYDGEMHIYTRCLKRGDVVSVTETPRCFNGITDKPLPVCKKAKDRCPILSAPVYGSKMCNPDASSVDSSCRFQCNKAYYLKGSEIRICGSNLQWSGKTPWCVLRPECPVPPPLLNGKINGCSKQKKPLYEDSCTFECNSGFELVGPDKLTCRLYGQLADINGREEYPYCIEKNPRPFVSPLFTERPQNPVTQSFIPCSHGTGGCHPECRSEGAFVRCSCKLGFRLREDVRLCEDIDECQTNVHHCQHICKNTYGSYECSCLPDYRLIDSHHCEAIQKSNTPSPLYPYGEPRSYQGKGSTARAHKSRSSCTWNNGGCTQRCETKDGVAKCECFDGYELENDGKNCRRISSFVSLTPDVHQKPDQKVHDRRDARVNPPVVSLCSRRNGGCDHICEENGTCSCHSGFRLKKDGKRCSDVDECVVDNFGCSHKCHNTLGGAFCSCSQGYQLHKDGKTCEDIDECLDINLNRCEQECYNREGSFKCSCRDGYISHKEFKCQACRYNSYRSSSDVLCLECPPYSYTKTDARTSIGDCLCSPGFVGNISKNIPCEDINECLSENFGCSDECVNTPGSAFCLCPPGFELQADQKTCQDINECSINNGGCQGLCHNTEGDFRCSCFKGYTISDIDRYSCTDVDECLDQNGHCSDLCLNFPGSYHCSCPEGYHVDREGRSCIAIRCSKFLVPLHSSVRCFNKNDFTNKTSFKPGELPDTMDFPSDTQCRVVCNKGYETDESARTIECQNNGKWNATLPECEVLQCPPLPVPENGDVDPPDCHTKSMPVGTRCYFTCHPDYRIAGTQAIFCSNNLTWTTKELPRCAPIKVVPFISCPEDITVELHNSNESYATFTLPPPITNMEDFQVHPKWVVVGRANDFPAGRTDVTYSINTWKNKTIKCEMSVTVSDQVPPVFDYCPDSFYVDGDVFGVQVYYDEPIASDNVGVSSTLKSMEPNSTLLPGTHVVTYVARDDAGNTAECSFTITVSRGAECIDLADPENGEANCVDLVFGKICEPICNVNYTLSLNDTNIFMCDDSGTWRPSDVIPPCLPECPFGEVWSSQLQRCEEEITNGLNNIPSA